MTNEITRAAQRVPGHWFQGGLKNPSRDQYCGIGHLYHEMGYRLDLHGADESVDTATLVVPINQVTVVEMLAYMNQAAEDKFPDRTKLFGSLLAEDEDPFAMFNDHKDTTETDVVAVMELAGQRWDLDHP